MLRSSACRRDRREEGFTLIEVLVAFVVLSLALAVILQSFSGGVRMLDDVSLYARAAAIAESKLDEIGTSIPLKNGRINGQVDDQFNWKIVMKSLPELADQNDYYEPPYKVTLDVTWRGTRGKRELSLSTVKMSY